MSTTAGGASNTNTNSKYGGTSGQNQHVQFSPGISGNVVCNISNLSSEAPDHQGWITNSGVMNGESIPAGTWTFVTRTRDTNGKPGPGYMHLRIYKTQVSGGNLSSPELILQIDDHTQDIAPGNNNFITSTFTGSASSFSFGASDYLYVEYWLHLPNAPGGAPSIDFEVNTSTIKITPPSGPPPPVVSSVDVTASSSGTPVANGVTQARQTDTIRINGSNFGATQGGSGVTINGSPATVTTWSDTVLSGIALPNGTNTGNIVVAVGGVPSNNFSFTILPRITSFANNTEGGLTDGARVAQSVTFNGDHFGTAGSVTVNGTVAGGSPVWSSTQITGVVINGGSISGNVLVSRTAPDTRTSGTSSGTFTLLPRITSVDVTASSSGTPLANGVSAARQSDTIRINGDHFGGSGTLSVNGTSATVGSWTDTQLTGIAVPNGTISGNIVATVNANNSNNKVFTILPRITSLNPATGPVGTSILINGDHFGADPGAPNRCIAANNVTFNATQALCADVTAWSDTQVTSKVPVGSSTGNVVVTFNSNASNGKLFSLGDPDLQSLAATAYADSSTTIFATAPFMGDANVDSTTAFAIDTSAGGPFSTVKCASVTGSSPRTCAITGLTTGTPYWVKITHTDPDGVSGDGTVSGNDISQIIGPFTPINELLVSGQATVTPNSTTSITVNAPLTAPLLSTTRFFPTVLGPMSVRVSQRCLRAPAILTAWRWGPSISSALYTQTATVSAASARLRALRSRRSSAPLIP